MKVTKFLEKLLGLKLLILVGHISQVFASCRILNIKTIFEDKALTNHTIRTIQPITNAGMCRAQCFLESLCFGVNFCVDEVGISTCELTNSDHIRSEKELVEKPGCAFYGSESGCSSSPCASNATCQADFLKVTPSYRCICPKGYSGQMCEIEMDECFLNTHNCHVYANCTNSAGGYNCTCKTGFYGNGTSCYDIDECASGVHGCSELANCVNFPGGHECTCKAGFHGDGIVCVDLDECAVNVHDCHVYANCANNYGGYDCTCKTGFHGNGTSCYDIDECALGTHGCSGELVICKNLPGGHECACKAGFQGDGIVCVDVDECASNVHECDVNAVCNNTYGGHNCTCKSGFYGNGKTCTDIDECSSDSHDCHVNATCINNAGGYTCKCNEGLYGNGRSCRYPTNCTEVASFASTTGFFLLQESQDLVYRFCKINTKVGCGDGIWTLAMKIDGDKRTFKFSSDLWRNSESYNKEALYSGMQKTETKQMAFWNKPVQKLCLGMTYAGETNWISASLQSSSLLSAISNKKTFTFGREKWISLLSPVHLEGYCKREGFEEPECETGVRYVISFWTNNRDHCGDCDASIGFGGTNPVCGDFHESRGRRPAFCYILVQ